MNLPNKLSMLRIIMVPLIVLFAFLDLGVAFEVQVQAERIVFGWSELLVVILFVGASITDYFDGQIARKRNLITSFGKFIDPIADKLLVNTMFILFAVFSRVSIIPVIVMIWRDMIVDGLRMSASSQGKVVAAGWWGKVKTVLQMAAIVLVLLHNLPFGFLGIPMDQILVWLAAFVSVMSGVQYFISLKDVVMKSM